MQTLAVGSDKKLGVNVVYILNNTVSKSKPKSEEGANFGVAVTYDLVKKNI